ncbi:glycosyltransferase family 4 protein [Fictibacillus sp. WQ 8-8]|uniref:glycosyltransferase family 4 protein n=1 Tax=Fictibacillus sp. WQ 8-8 TaxID=2938788 RepID=UPI00210A068B|nr:glycosyltransferase family 4 protein [Fictibacillus sp. WQ 8-8]MCQ6264732.1 glycosyltransferase family 4 protein [Fictibacillus sp. WQ 8-8]
MKILYVSTISNTVNAFLIPHIKYLLKEGHQVDIASNVIQEVSSELSRLGCNIHNIEFQRSPLKKENFSAYKKLKDLVLFGKYDIIHTHTPIASFIARIACRNISNIKILYTAHGFHFFKGAPLKNWLIYYPMEKFAANYTDAIITINSEDYNSANKLKNTRLKSVFKVHGVGIDFKKFTYNNSQQKNILRSKYGYNSEDFILFYAAELNYNKHQDLLIEVINKLKTKIPNIKLLLAGEGSLKEKYEEQVNKYDLGTNIEFLGFRNDIPNLLKLSDVAVSASRREGLPVNVMEAMATGLPLIVTNCRGNRDLVTNGKNGYVTGVNNIDEFTRVVEELYNSHELRIKLSENSIELIKDYSTENVIKELEQIYLNYFK